MASCLLKKRIRKMGRVSIKKSMTSEDDKKLQTKVTPTRRLRSRKLVTKVSDKSVKNAPVVEAERLKSVLQPTKLKHRDTKESKHAVNEKKFFKSKCKLNLECVEEPKKNNRKNINMNKRFVKMKKDVDNSFRLRQMSIQESLSQSLISKKLRPREIKNYKDDSSLIQKHLPQGKQNSIVIVEHIKQKENLKLPVYKTMNVEDKENSIKSPNAIYDFKFDADDSKEKLVKKKRRKVITKRTVKKAASTIKKKNKVNVPQEAKVESSTKESKCEVKTKINNLNESKLLEKIEQMEVNQISQNTLKNPAKEINEIRKKPKVIKIETLNNVKINIPTYSTSHTDNFQPFRITNAFKKSSLTINNLQNHSLFNKSLSPITKVTTNFDPGSPWRVPQLQTFSNVKNVFQSTPEIKQSFKKPLKSLTENKPKILKPVIENNNIDTNIPLQRKFGTVITNQENSPIITSDTKSPRKKNILNGSTAITKNNLLIENNSPTFSAADIVDDKENTVPNYQTPVKTGKRKENRPHTNLNLLGAEKMDNIPGPSELIQENCHDSRILKQSSLNSFLNITEMPESTKIHSAYGIFDHENSTPLTSNRVKRIKKREKEDNLFGFSDSASELDISSINPEENKENSPIKRNKIIEKIVKPARLSIREIQNKLLPRKQLVKLTRFEKVEELRKESHIVEEEDKSSIQEDEKQKTFDIVSFSDTFDILPENANVEKENEVCPLFMDLEPIHFKAPPRHSYSRKRNAKFSFCEDNEEEEESFGTTEIKKRKIAKLSKEEKKRLQQWVKSVNETFEEIDEYDLIVE
ncbi:coiled-coil domain-containing protein 7-like [Prorops nasuta]|uniref:coiled-coil domain-containing protein 7-like n=1 Tax=Prorops nasuta TaxID=863751 RepID=UPI0034CDEAD9